jgi:hypothetical protein
MGQKHLIVYLPTIKSLNYLIDMLWVQYWGFSDINFVRVSLGQSKILIISFQKSCPNSSEIAFLMKFSVEVVTEITRKTVLGYFRFTKTS